jgi:hypothetical protein
MTVKYIKCACETFKSFNEKQIPIRTLFSKAEGHKIEDCKSIGIHNSQTPRLGCNHQCESAQKHVHIIIEVNKDAAIRRIAVAAHIEGLSQSEP